MGMMQYKKGSNFEQEFSKILAKNGFWACVIPKARDGSQPFDVISERHGKAYNFDCKTLKGYKFPLSRVEENQKRAFSKLERCGCDNNYFAIKCDSGEIYVIPAYTMIMLKESGDKYIDVKEGTLLEDFLFRVNLEKSIFNLGVID